MKLKRIIPIVLAFALAGCSGGGETARLEEAADLIMGVVGELKGLVRGGE